MNHKTLFLITFGYFLIPNLLFLFFWFDLIYAFISILGILIGYFFVIKQVSCKMPIDVITVKSLLVLSLVSIGIVTLSGTGGLFPQVNDFWGHNAKLNDLYHHEWPLVIKDAKTFYSYYFGFYLVVCATAKLFGGYLIFINFLGTCIGLFIALNWLFLFFEKNFKKLFLALSISIPSASLLDFLTGNYYSYFMLDEYHLYIHDLMRSIQWEPQILIPSIICAGFVLYEVKYLKSSQTFLLFVPLALIFSPFLVLILAIYFLLFTSINLINNSTYFREIDFKFIIIMALIGIFTLPIFAYFTSNNKTQEIEIIISNSKSSFIYTYFFYIFFNIVGFFICVYRRKDFSIRKSQYLSVFIILLILPLFKMGQFNDLARKSSTLPIFVLYYYFSEEFYLSLQNKTYKLLQIVVYLFCLSGLFSFFYVQFKFYNFIPFGKPISESKIPFYAYDNIDKMLREQYSEEGALEYRGDMNSIYAKYLAKNTLEKALEKK